MLRIRLFAMALVVGLAGVVYAAGRAQEATPQHGAHTADKAACCKAGHQKDAQKTAMSCDKDGCCKGHKAEGESCCAGGNCCKDGAECCKGHQKAGATAVKTSATDEAESCCKDGAACCKDGAECCKGHKAAGQKAGQKHEGCCGCCGDSCQKDGGR